MTDHELAAIVRGIGPVLREYVTKQLQPYEMRLAATEGQLVGGVPRDRLEGLTERLVIIETKAGLAGDGVVEIRTQLQQALETQRTALAGLGDRLLTLEIRAGAPDPADRDVAEALGELRQRLETLATVTTDLSDLRERVAIVETRGLMPGPPGEDGRDGQDGAPGRDGMPGREGIDGKDGRDGLDGLGFDDLSVDFDGDRQLTLAFVRGPQTKAFPITLPFLRWQGVYQTGRSYTVGDVVTFGGSAWHCQHDTLSKPGDGSPDWKLMVKHGRDGKDGAPGRDGLQPGMH